MRGLPFARIVFVAAAVAIALLTPFGPFLATSLLIDSANQLGYAWVVPLVVLATVLSAGTILRDAARILDRPAHAREVLRGVQAPPRDVMSYSPSSTAYVWGAIATLGAIGFATVGLYRQRLPAFTRRLLSPAA